MGLWYRTGSVSITQGTNSLTGTGTAWASQLHVGDAFTYDFQTWYEVVVVADDTHATLDRNYTGANLANANYAVLRVFANSTNADLAARLATQIQTVQG